VRAEEKMPWMTASARHDLEEPRVEEVRRHTRPKSIDTTPPDTSEEIASLTARLEAVEASTRRLSDALHELRGTLRDLNRSNRHYRLFDQP
jgi:hypothetical protein